jgi:hypothetical protein
MPERASGGYPGFRRTVTGSRLYPGLRAGSVALSMASLVIMSTAWRRGVSEPGGLAWRSLIFRGRCSAHYRRLSP